MVTKDPHIIDEYLERAQQKSSPDTVSVPVDTLQETQPEVTPQFLKRSVEDPYYRPLTQKPKKKRKVSPFTVVLFLFVGAILIVVYINNIITVNHLMREINVYERRHQQLLNEQELLRARIHKLSSFERVQQIAQYNLGLTFPKEVPQVLRIDPSRIEEVKRVVGRVEGGD